jgi:hypothetical protein
MRANNTRTAFAHFCQKEEERTHSIVIYTFVLFRPTGLCPNAPAMFFSFLEYRLFQVLYAFILVCRTVSLGLRIVHSGRACVSFNACIDE